MNKDQISAKILGYIKKNGEASYAEIEHIFEDNDFDYHGSMELYSEANEHVVFWAGWNEEATELIACLINSGKLERIPCQPFRYLLDGKALNYPVLKGDPDKIRTPHWLPCVFKV